MAALDYHATPTDALLKARLARKIRHSDVTVFLVISRYANVKIVNGYRRDSFPSIASIAAWSGRRPQDVPAALDRLAAVGLIETDDRRAGKVTVWRIPLTAQPGAETAPGAEPAPGAVSVQPSAVSVSQPSAEPAPQPIAPTVNQGPKGGAQAPNDKTTHDPERRAAIMAEIQRVVSDSAGDVAIGAIAALQPLAPNPEADAHLAEMRAKRAAAEGSE